MKRICLILCLVLLVTTVGVSVKADTPYQFNLCSKYSENPVFPSGDNDWDYDKHYPSVIYNPDWATESQYRMWYMGVSNKGELCTCYAYSSDGDSWVKPNVGRIEYEGSANNNIILELGRVQTDVYYDDITGEYILLVGEDTTKGWTRHAVDIYTSSSPDGIFVLEKNLPVDVGYPGIYHGYSLVERLDGRWYVYYQYRDESNYRNIGAYLSDTTALDGAWTDLGVLIECASVNEQRYSIDVFTYNNKYYAALLNYSVATDLTWIVLWDSDDGESWNYLYNWIDNGEEGEWDEGVLWEGEFVNLGDSWRYYYSGGHKAHGQVPKREVAIGYIHEYIQDIEQLACGAYLSSVQTIPNKVNTEVELNALTYDTHGAFSISNNEYVCLEDGLYLAIGQVTYHNPSVGSRLITYLLRNTTRIANGQQTVGGEICTGPGCSGVVPALAGDTFKMQTWHNSGVNENIRVGSDWTYMYVVKIG